MMKSESWKYTNIKKWQEQDYQQIISPMPSVCYGANDAYPLGVIICSLREARLLHQELLGTIHWPLSPTNVAPNDGLFIYIPKNLILQQPLYLNDVATQLDRVTLLNTGCVVLLEPNSSATIVHTFQAYQATDYWRNHMTNIKLANNAQLSYYQIQNEACASLHTHHITVQQARDSQFNSLTLDNGGGTVRTDLHTQLQAENAGCQLRGIYLAKNNQHVDNHTVIEHLSPHTHSSELYKGIITDQARAVFNGRVYVAPHAQKIVSEQHNENLLLSKHAEIDTKPELEIHADDVQCAHGATVGQLEQDAIFYLTTRGIDEELARQLLTYGFAQEMINNISHNAIKELFNTQLLTWFNNAQLEECRLAALEPVYQ